MDSRAFNDLYDAMYQHYGDDFRDDQQRNLAVHIREIIDRVIDERNIRPVRADGKFFLLLNFHQMVAAPRLSAPPTRRIGEEELFNAIGDDVVGILNICMSTPGDEISSHLILSAADLYWQFSRTLVEQYWP